jgi:hypothetical protein
MSSPFAVQRKRTSAVSSARAEPTYSREDILDCIKKWNELYGPPPITSDWEPSRARQRREEWRVQRFESGRWPTLRVVRRPFGRFNAAIEAAG